MPYTTFYNNSKTFIAKKTGLFIHDSIRSTSICKIRKKLFETQFWSDKRLKNYQFGKLSELLIYAYEAIPYYHDKFMKYDLDPYKLTSLSDFKKYPILKKEKIISANLVNYKVKKIKMAKTGGTTGPPLTVFRDTKSRTFAWAAYYRWYNWMGIEYGDPVVTLWGAPTVLSKSFFQQSYNKLAAYFANDLRINSFSINNESFPNIIKQIHKQKPKLIKGYLSSLLQLANYIIDNNIVVNVDNIAPTSETLFPQYREKLEFAFKGKVYDQYGFTEITSVAFECPEHNGLHVNSEHVIAEVIDKNGNHVYNEPGKLIVTDLDNTAMPFIRYMVGDTAVMSDKKCSCGCMLPLIKSIEGRTADTIQLRDGSEVHGVFFTDIFYELEYPNEIDKIDRFQVIQRGKNEITIKIQTSKKIDESFKKDLYKALSKFIDVVNIEVKKLIKNEPSGKFRYIKNDL